MDNHRSHFAITTDGIKLGGTVHGDGPPIVFWHGAYGDGDLDWQGLLPHLTGHFTCYLPSWRGRGLSDEHPDLSYDRRVADVIDYVASLEEPAGIVGWSGGANPAVAAAARSGRLNAVALVEPTMGSVMTEDERVTFGGAVARLGELAASGDLTEALRAAAGFPFNDEEIAVADDAGYFEAAGRYVPNLLSTFTQLREHQGPVADDPSVLGAVSAPVLVVHGANTKPFWIRSAPARGRPRPHRPHPPDPRRRTRCPADPSRVTCCSAHRVLFDSTAEIDASLRAAPISVEHPGDAR